jgi:RNA polymerase sigma factor (TIGR02999 family)
MTHAGSLSAAPPPPSAPAPPAPGDVTQWLRRASAGDREAYDRVFTLAHDELRRVAERQLHRGATVGAAELVAELYLKFGGARDAEVGTALRGPATQGRAHFYAVAARAMRQILVDLARRQLAEKRGGGWVVTTLTGKPDAQTLSPETLIALDDALATLDVRQRAVVEARFFAGLTDEEIAEALGISVRTVAREWVRARAWLYRTLSD